MSDEKPEPESREWRVQRAEKRSTDATSRLTQAVPGLTGDEAFEMAVRLARLEAFAHRLINLNSRERRIITLSQIQDWAEIALGKETPDRVSRLIRMAQEIVDRDGELLRRLGEE